MKFSGLLAKQWHWGLTGVIASTTLLMATRLVVLAAPERTSLQSSIADFHAIEQRTEVSSQDAAVILRSLPEAGHANVFLSSLLREAIKANVELRDIEVLSPADDARGLLEQLKVSAKLVGTYSDVKQAAAEAMRGEPSSALDSLTITRMPQGQTVEALMQWSVYHKSAGGR